MARQRFPFVMIKPSHYDDDGYVIQWAYSWVPSNSLASLYGLARECAESKVLGDDVDIELQVFDETNTRINVKKIIKSIKQAGHGMVGFVGVQSNQFPHAMDLARQFRQADIPVCIGGFHVSGCIAMLPELPAGLKEAQDLGISLYAGEAEGRLDEVFKDAYNGELKPMYNYLNDLPALEGATQPFLPAKLIGRHAGSRTSFDAGRGCPFLCSFCTIINVQGRKSRFRSPDDVEQIIRDNLAQDINSFFISDDNFARNRNWEALFDRMIKMREEEGLKFKFLIQVDTMCHKIKGFIEKAARAGVNRAFVGLESINPDSLKDARKGQNRITEYRAVLQAWQNAGATVYAGYILGFPSDTPESIANDLAIIQRELPVDMVELACLTPLPGSQDHKELLEKGVDMDPDMNNYDLQHVCTDHATMSRDEWRQVYRDAWDIYYHPSHVETLLRRAKARGYNVRGMKNKILSSYGCWILEHVHPLEGGLIRRKYRKDRRPEMPRESALVFYPKYTWEMITKHVKAVRMLMQYNRIARMVEQDDTPYTDKALEPVTLEDMEELEMFNVTDAAKVTFDKARNPRKKPVKKAPVAAQEA